MSSAPELRLHFIRSPLGIRWSSPRTLGFSALFNAGAGQIGAGFAIGHVNIELVDQEGKSIFGGMTVARKSDQTEILISGKIGLGVLFHRFEGKREDEEAIRRGIRWARRQGRWSCLRMKISPEAFSRCRTYHQEYHALGHTLEYGFPSEPRRREGSGCTAFAISYLEVGGLMEQEFFSWRREVHVPEVLVGQQGREVTPWEILYSPAASRWAEPGEGRRLEFWCPDLMYRWVTAKGGREHILDLRDRPVPYDSFWLGK